MNDSHDPLTALFGEDLPVTPDPVFAARLRPRLEAALSLPAGTEGVDMSGTDSLLAELTAPTPTAAWPARWCTWPTSIPNVAPKHLHHSLFR